MISRPLLDGFRKVPFILYRSGTSRGPFFLEKDLPLKGSERDAIICRIMGSGHPQQIQGLGGGCGPTSKAVVVGSGDDENCVTFSFYQCSVNEARVDHSHGDCGNMLAAVAPFAIEKGLVQHAQQGATRSVKIHSLVTGALYSADVLISSGIDGRPKVKYAGDCAIANVPGEAAPVTLTTYKIAGSQTGKLLPTGAALDYFELTTADRRVHQVSVTCLDFARALIVLDADEILPFFGYDSILEATKDRIEGDVALNHALEGLRQKASQAMGMGDCRGKDSPKVAIVSNFQSSCKFDVVSSSSSSAKITCRYFVNPGRSEMHPSIAMTAAQALGAACLLEGSVAQRALLRGSGEYQGSDGVNCGFVEQSNGNGAEPNKRNKTYSFEIAHELGLFAVNVSANEAQHEKDQSLWPLGVPDSAKYRTTVWPIAEGHAFL
eukprot:TRINITY_DN79905_c0_g1_i1.p1 TRINITY_DN79905_c0_g1~~TRINITY_DN79905_c0_g1_i1.p1  ORF type:complete len:435 (+),score=60.59 TRINITY_DN79905_c0_g1_i1:103-1407(+)